MWAGGLNLGPEAWGPNLKVWDSPGTLSYLSSIPGDLKVNLVNYTGIMTPSPNKLKFI